MICFESFDRFYGRRLPKLRTTRNSTNPIVYCRFYDKNDDQEWYVIEGEKVGKTYIFYGYLIGRETTLGQFTLTELVAKGTVEISLLFKPCPVSYIQSITSPEKIKPTV